MSTVVVTHGHRHVSPDRYRAVRRIPTPDVEDVIALARAKGLDVHLASDLACSRCPHCRQGTP